MEAGQTGVPVAQPTVEEKIDQALEQSASVVAPFSAAAAEAIQAGVAVEPIISGLVKLFAGIFSHHAKQAVAAQS